MPLITLTYILRFHIILNFLWHFVTYGPDLADLFPGLKSDLRGNKFNNDEEIKPFLIHFGDKPPQYVFKGIKMLIRRCGKCTQTERLY